MTQSKFSDWRTELIRTEITDELISALNQHDIRLAEMTEQSFQGCYLGQNESEAGKTVARDMAALNMLQAFLEPAINWEQAWQNLSRAEGYILLPTPTRNTWALFNKNNY